MAENGVFYLGLTMAGGISAGAYSAGVFDFLIQALEEWERAKQADRKRPLKDREVPNHAVVIPVIRGASAGGITGALGILSAADHFDMPEPAQAAATRAVLPTLYETWVQSISFTPKNGRPSHLLDVGDLERGADPVVAGRHRDLRHRRSGDLQSARRETGARLLRQSPSSVPCDHQSARRALPDTVHRK